MKLFSTLKLYILDVFMGFVFYEEKEHQPSVLCNGHATGFLLRTIFFIEYRWLCMVLKLGRFG